MQNSVVNGKKLTLLVILLLILDQALKIWEGLIEDQQQNDKECEFFSVHDACFG